MQQKIIKLTAMFTGIFMVAVLITVVLYQVNKPKIQMIEAGKQPDIQSTAHSTEQTQNVQGGRNKGTSIPVTDHKEHDRTFHLILSDDVDTQNESTVSVEVDYVNKMVLLTLQNISERELEGCQMMADPLVVVSEEVSVTEIPDQSDGCVLMIPETDYETCQLGISETEIVVTFEQLRPSSEYTVVIDAGHGGEDTGTKMNDLTEKDLSLAVIEQLQPMLAGESDSMRIFYTRTSDMNVNDADRVAFANAVKADVFLSLHMNLEPAESNGLRAYYNDTYFIPEFGSIELSNLMEEEVIQKIGGIANGLFPAAEGDVIVRESKVPVTRIEIDSACTENDQAIMKTESYQKQIAEGIYEGIMRAYAENSADTSK